MRCHQPLCSCAGQAQCSGTIRLRSIRTGSVVRDGDRKYLYFYSDGQSELYNLKEDNGETKNLIDTMPEKAAAMKGLLDAELKKHNATSPTAVPVNPSRRGRKKCAEKNQITNYPTKTNSSAIMLKLRMSMVAGLCWLVSILGFRGSESGRDCRWL